jgi:succinyl-diaminopimelate desuccinylase
MTQSYSPLALTRDLIAFNTVNPPGREQDCARFVGRLLEDGGFNVAYHDFDEGRTSLIARKIFNDDRPPLCFTGHFDTVPLGMTPWKMDPFKGELDGDRLYGRGASDMKGGLAAIILAALNISSLSCGSSGIVLVLTAGEENGCQGAQHLAEQEDVLGKAGALLVGEPTANYPMVGHKGAFWIEAVATGITAHGSMPEQGVNAIYKAARAILELNAFDFGIEPHPVLGAPTLNIGTITGGINPNSVPDRASFTIDIRTVPPQSDEQITQALQIAVGKEIVLKNQINAPAVASDPNNQWIREVFGIMTAHIGEQPVPRGVTYFTDASALTNAFGHIPTVILGPGEPGMAHKTDEYCHLSRIEAATAAYTEIARKWCRL